MQETLIKDLTAQNMLVVLLDVRWECTLLPMEWKVRTMQMLHGLQ